jgi:hypothetical protein
MGVVPDFLDVLGDVDEALEFVAQFRLVRTAIRSSMGRVHVRIEVELLRLTVTVTETVTLTE